MDSSDELKDFMLQMKIVTPPSDENGEVSVNNVKESDAKQSIEFLNDVELNALRSSFNDAIEAYCNMSKHSVGDIMSKLTTCKDRKLLQIFGLTGLQLQFSKSDKEIKALHSKIDEMNKGIETIKILHHTELDDLGGQMSDLLSAKLKIIADLSNKLHDFEESNFNDLHQEILKKDQIIQSLEERNNEMNKALANEIKVIEHYEENEEYHTAHIEKFKEVTGAINKKWKEKESKLHDLEQENEKLKLMLSEQLETMKERKSLLERHSKNIQQKKSQN